MSGSEFARKRVAVGLALAVMPMLSSANQARVDFSIGEVLLKSASGAQRSLGKGATVGSGDTIFTGENARVQLRFSDGSYVSLQPQSEFRIDQYQFNGKQDGTERGFFSLLKGGLRTITGLVGRSNKKNYQVSTGVATIGIRGTEYSISADGQVRGSVGDGEIQVCNGGGCLIVANGESYKVASLNTQALMTEKKVDLPAPPVQPGVATINVGGPGAASGGFSGGGDVIGAIVVPTLPINDSIISGTTPGLPAPPTTAAQLTGIAQVLAHDAFTGTSGSLISAHSVPGRLPTGSFYDGSGNAVTPVPGGPTLTLTGSSNLTWTHYLNADFFGSPKFASPGIAGYYPTVHQISGNVTPLSGMPVGVILTYSCVGYTDTTFTSGGAVSAGGINGASLTVDFAKSTASLSMNFAFLPTVGGGATTYSGNGVIDGNTLRFDTLTAASAPCPTCWAGSASGFFAGTNAQAVGLGYKVEWNGFRGVGIVAFTQ